MTGIYKIQSLLDKRCYVGKAKNIDKRNKFHFSRLKIGKHHNNLLQRFYNKYGSENLELQIVELCNYDELNEKEIFWIKELKSMEFGFNMTGGGEINPMDYAENRKKVSDSLKGHVKSKEWINKILKNRGDKFFESKVKSGSIKYIYAYSSTTLELLHGCYGYVNMAKHLNIGESNIRQVINGKMKTAKGNHFSLKILTKDEVKNAIIYDNTKAEYKLKMSKIATGENNGMFGKVHSESTKIKIAEKAKERYINRRLAEVELYLSE